MNLFGKKGEYMRLFDTCKSTIFNSHENIRTCLNMKQKSENEPIGLQITWEGAYR